MANVLYNSFKQSLLTAGLDVEADSILVILADAADYTFSAAHDFLDDVPAGARVATSGALASKTIVSGVFDSADFTWTAVTGDPSEQIIIYDNTPGTEASKNLIAFYDTGITGMPVTPNGGNINLTVHASGWFALIALISLSLLGVVA